MTWKKPRDYGRRTGDAETDLFGKVYVPRWEDAWHYKEPTPLAVENGAST